MLDKAKNKCIDILFLQEVHREKTEVGNIISPVTKLSRGFLGEGVGELDSFKPQHHSKRESSSPGGSPHPLW